MHSSTFLMAALAYCCGTADGFNKEENINITRTKRDYLTTSRIHCTASTSFNYNSSESCNFCNYYCPCKGPSRVADFAPCVFDEECSAKEVCVYGACVDPCNYYSCPNKTVCQPSRHQITCRAITPAEGCVTNDQCPEDRACVDSKCVDPCVGRCGANTECQIKHHWPNCVCKPGHTGNPLDGCENGYNKGPKQFVFHASQRANWYTAHMICMKNNGRLARIENEDERKKVELIIKSSNVHNNPEGGEYWIGGTDQPHEGVWRWSFTEQEIGNYRPWHGGQPDNFDGIQHCMTITDKIWTKHFNTMMWDDNHCPSEKFFVCEY